VSLVSTLYQRFRLLIHEGAKFLVIGGIGFIVTLGGADVLHLGLGPGAHPGDGRADRSPLGLVVRHRGEDVGVSDDAVTGQSPAQRLHENACRGHDGTLAIRPCSMAKTLSRARWQRP